MLNREMRSRRLVSGLFLGTLLAACGGATATDLFTDPADATAPTSTTTSTVPTTTGTPTTTSPTTKPTDEPPTITDGSVPPRDASDGSRPDANTVRDGGPGINCGTLTCGAADTCCAQFMSGTYRFECRAGQVTCAEPSTQINCDSNEDCPNSAAKICCGDRVTAGGFSYYDNLKCAATCTGNDVIFCNPANPTPACGAKACQESTILRGYYACAP